MAIGADCTMAFGGEGALAVGEEGVVQSAVSPVMGACGDASSRLW
jgi:hypothetical protein